MTQLRGPCDSNLYNCFRLPPAHGGTSWLEDGGELREYLAETSLKCRRDFKLTPEIFRDDTLSIGGKVKQVGEVVMAREDNCIRMVNVNCRVDALGKVVESCVGLKRKWVMEMGFGGLLNLAYKQLPRTLCYWLMTRVDPYSEMLIAPDGHEFRLSKIQVGWVLGIISGELSVPRKAESKEMKKKIIELESKY